MKDEFALIRQITPKATKQPSLQVGIGDDAAIYTGSDDYDEVICVDTMVEDIHFRRDTLTPFQIGYKGLAINISDLAAMGALPMYYLVSIAIPRSWTEEEIRAIYKGMHQLGHEYAMDLIGGDTVSTRDKLVLTVTAIGRVETGRKLLRSNAKADDVVFVTGTIGKSAAGLELLFERGLNGSYSEKEQELVKAHQQPSPRVEAGRIFARSGYRLALNDVSDGVGSEANELAEASNVSICIEEDKLPFHPSLTFYSDSKKLKLALFGGEDFELIGTASIQDFRPLQKQCEDVGVQLTEIGYVEKGKAGVSLIQHGKRIVLKKEGYNHFRNG
ncbi:thiamine-phosphate kinase [Halalkalibacterium ligniniphilum]|uniref:thiamine-phosphate kinase n=1 Tax=Halalkalibacterium ligniniphilum TaxID=1134413 RepID=UPI000345BD7E|nr:thiamine-phosphate kinase [Halalkalibacterium ligniniphilum]